MLRSTVVNTNYDEKFAQRLHKSARKTERALPPRLFKSRLEERTRPFCCCDGKTKAAECLGGETGRGENDSGTKKSNKD